MYSIIGFCKCNYWEVAANVDRVRNKATLLSLRALNRLDV